MISWPWDSVFQGFDEETGFPIGDRMYKAEQLRAIMRKVFSNGVFAETPEAFVVSVNGMTVNVSPGTCHIQGDIGVEDETSTLMLTAAPNQNRIDTVVLRWDANISARDITIDVIQGVPAASPKRPELTRTASVWELGLADVYIPKGATSINSSRVTDTRLETSRCGIVTPFTTIDTTTFFNQIQIAIQSGTADIDRLTRELEAEIERTKELADSLIGETFVGQVMEILEELAKKHVIWLSIDDDATDAIDDSNGDRLLGDVKFGIGGSGGCDCDPASDEEIDQLFVKIREVQANNG